jgi:hypothetical protein
MRKIVGYFILFVSGALNLCGANSQAKDLAIYFDVEEQPKARFYRDVMQGQHQV